MQQTGDHEPATDTTTRPRRVLGARPGSGPPETRNRLLAAGEPVDDEMRASTLAPQWGPLAGSAALIALSLLAVMVVWPSSGDGLVPRVATVDGLAGLVVGAFLVDRLLTFMPPTLWASHSPAEREAAVAVLRFGWGAVIAAVFVAVTGLQAVQALVGDAGDVSPELDRAFAVLAIAGGTVGLAGLSSALNPKPMTDQSLAKNPGKARVTDDEMPTMPPPHGFAYLFGATMLGVAVVVAALKASGDSTGVDLLGAEAGADATAALVIRFGLLLLAAGVVQQLVALVDRTLINAKMPVAEEARGLVLGGLAVVLGVLFAAGLDVYLLHNLGFFGTAPGVAGAGSAVDAALASATDAERIFDLFITGVVIAAGTKPLNDLSMRLRTAKRDGQQRMASAA